MSLTTDSLFLNIVLNTWDNVSSWRHRQTHTHTQTHSNTHTCPRKVSSRWATSESRVTREKLKISATGRVSARQETWNMTSNYTTDNYSEYYMTPLILLQTYEQNERGTVTPSFALWTFFNPLNFREPFKQPEKIRDDSIFVLQHKWSTACYMEWKTREGFPCTHLTVYMIIKALIWLVSKGTMFTCRFDSTRKMPSAMTASLLLSSSWKTPLKSTGHMHCSFWTCERTTRGSNLPLFPLQWAI